MIFRASQRSRIGGRLATHCVKHRLSGLQWHMNGGGFKPPPLFFNKKLRDGEIVGGIPSRFQAPLVLRVRCHLLL